MTAPTLDRPFAWLDLHTATALLPDGTAFRVLWDWDRDGWVTDLPGCDVCESTPGAVVQRVAERLVVTA